MVLLCQKIFITGFLVAMERLESVVSNSAVLIYQMTVLVRMHIPVCLSLVNCLKSDHLLKRQLGVVSDEDNNRFLADAENPIAVNVDNMEFSDYCKSKKQVTSVGHKMISISNFTAVGCTSECVGNMDSCFP